MKRRKTERDKVIGLAVGLAVVSETYDIDDLIDLSLSLSGAGIYSSSITLDARKRLGREIERKIEGRKNYDAN